MRDSVPENKKTAVEKLLYIFDHPDPMKAGAVFSDISAALAALLALK